MRIHAYGLSLTVVRALMQRCASCACSPTLAVCAAAWQADVAVRSLEEDVADLPFFRAFVGARAVVAVCCTCQH